MFLFEALIGVTWFGRTIYEQLNYLKLKSNFFGVGAMLIFVNKQLNNMYCLTALIKGTKILRYYFKV